METLEKIALVPTIIGAINWGLVGAFDINLVTMLFKDSIITNLVYIIVAICGLINIAILFMHLEKDPV